MFGGIIPLVNGNRLNVIVLHLQIISSKWQLVAVADCRAEIWPSTLIAKLTGEFQPLFCLFGCTISACASTVLATSNVWKTAKLDLDHNLVFFSLSLQIFILFWGQTQTCTRNWNLYSCAQKLQRGRCTRVTSLTCCKFGQCHFEGHHLVHFWTTFKWECYFWLSHRKCFLCILPL